MIDLVFQALGIGKAIDRGEIDPQVMHAAVATVIAEAAPAVTIAAGTPIRLAIRAPTFSCSSGIETNAPAASAIACTTSGGISEPPSVV